MRGNEFKIGDYVSCAAYYEPVYRGDYGKPVHRVMERVLTKGFRGWIVGCVRKFEGVYKGGYGYDEQAGLVVRSSKMYYKVATSMMNEPKCVAIEDILDVVELANTKTKTPLKVCRFGSKMLEALKEDMKEWPRDEKGRWTRWQGNQHG